MKTYKFLLMMAVMTIVATACTQDADVPTPAIDDRPLVVTASLPVQAWGVESRGDGENAAETMNLTLHYTASNAQENDSPCSFKITNFTYNDNKITFTTAANNDDANSQRLVWSQIKSNTPLYLTADKEGLAYWAKADKVTPGTDLLFDEMGLRMSRFTVVLDVNGIADFTADDFTLSLSGVKQAANSSSVISQAWDCANEDLTSVLLKSEAVESKLTYTADFAPQTGSQELTISYKGTTLGKITLSNVSFSEGNKKANQWEAGDHITLNVQVSLALLNTPSITVTGFTAEDNTNNFNGTVTTNP